MEEDRKKKMAEISKHYHDEMDRIDKKYRKRREEIDKQGRLLFILLIILSIIVILGPIIDVLIKDVTALIKAIFSG